MKDYSTAMRQLEDYQNRVSADYVGMTNEAMDFYNTERVWAMELRFKLERMLETDGVQ